MKTANNPENQQPHGLGNLGQISADRNHTREEVEQIIDGLDMGQANLTQTIKAMNGLSRGAYFVSIRDDREWNEIQVRLRDNPYTRSAIAVGHIDKGHDAKSRREAAQEVRSLVRAYLCR
ncbi:hypothetical protein [Dechloromonas hortensis]|uniref:hypothetical protein n=1 Tax=Dechloromonas hortensis TaxID=337779 RepID=UPI001292849B|nr:hypothetical protein [Dechloromonas hortensis]